MAFLTFLISLLALLMALDNRRSLVELKRRHRQITHKAKDLAPSKQGEAGVPSTKPQGLQYHPSQVPKTNDASHEPSSSSEAAPPPLPQSISQGSGFSDSSSSLNLSIVVRIPTFKRKMCLPVMIAKSRGARINRAYFPE